MTINSILSISEGKFDRVSINEEPTKQRHLKNIDSEQFYVEPVITDVRTNSKASTLDPIFVLISAPGATGKTALAEHISYAYNALYLDMSEFRIGTNSFIGTLHNDIGVENVSEFIKKLKNGDAALVIDALDEAELSSGRNAVQNFLNEIYETIIPHTGRNIFLLCRTETAQGIVNYFVQKKIAFLHYEIGLFQPNKAKEFVSKYVHYVKKRDITIIDGIIDQYFKNILAVIPDSEAKSFIGYAPVLEAIGEEINNESNPQKLLVALQYSTCTELIVDIMKSLLDREKDKFISNIKPSLEEKGIFDWKYADEYYTRDEQLQRLIYYLVFDKSTEIDIIPKEINPSEVVPSYQKALSVFLPQHPFISDVIENNSGVRFTGPAFRDYSLSTLLCGPENEVASLYMDSFTDSKTHFPSQIFFDCYLYNSKDRIKVEHIPLLFEAFRSKAKANECPSLYFFEDMNSHSAYVEFSIESVDLNGETKEKKIEEKSEVLIDKIDTMVMFRSLNNVHIDAPDICICLGEAGQVVNISDSTIYAKSIQWGSEIINIKEDRGLGTILEPIEGFRGHLKRVEIDQEVELSVISPNTDEYYWLRKYNCAKMRGKPELYQYVQALRAIIMQFRSHSKDTIAKDAERIDNIIIGRNNKESLKANVLDHLVHLGIVYRFKHLYKCEGSLLDQWGIYQSALIQNDYRAFDKIYNDFIIWLDTVKDSKE